MRHLLTALIFFTSSCSERSSFIQKDHDIIKKEMSANYEKNRQAFQALAKEVAAFDILRAIEFKNGRSGTDGIDVYCDSLDRNGDGYSLVVQDLSDPQLQKILDQEGITRAALLKIKQQLGQINCNSFFTLRQPDLYTGTSFIHVELKYNDWNGANFYFYRIFDKTMEPAMIERSDRKNVTMGTIKSTGGILDSNAVWYLKAD